MVSDARANLSTVRPNAGAAPGQPVRLIAAALGVTIQTCCIWHRAKNFV